LTLPRRKSGAPLRGRSHINGEVFLLVKITQ
jgi:hypothetical protein